MVLNQVFRKVPAVTLMIFLPARRRGAGSHRAHVVQIDPVHVVAAGHLGDQIGDPTAEPFIVNIKGIPRGPPFRELRMEIGLPQDHREPGMDLDPHLAGPRHEIPQRVVSAHRPGFEIEIPGGQVGGPGGPAAVPDAGDIDVESGLPDPAEGPVRPFAGRPADPLVEDDPFL